jgi:hypothetical protein
MAARCGQSATDIERNGGIAGLRGADRRLGHVRPPSELTLGHAGGHPCRQELAAVPSRELAPSIPSEIRRT